jgi:hypothetical protein
VRRREGFHFFGQKTLYLLELRYSEKSPVGWQADSLEELGDFDPMRLDGLNTEAKLKMPKTNWAPLLDKPPYMA